MYLAHILVIICNLSTTLVNKLHWVPADLSLIWHLVITCFEISCIFINSLWHKISPCSSGWPGNLPYRCTSHSFHCCDQIPDEIQIKGGRGRAQWHGQVATGHIASSTRKQRVNRDCVWAIKSQCLFPVTTSTSRFYLLKDSQPFQTFSPSSWGQVFKNMSMWRTFHIQTTIIGLPRILGNPPALAAHQANCSLNLCLCILSS